MHLETVTVLETALRPGSKPGFGKTLKKRREENENPFSQDDNGFPIPGPPPSESQAAILLLCSVKHLIT